MTAMGPLPSAPIVAALLDVLAPTLPAAFGHLPVDRYLKARELPVLVVDRISPRWIGPPFGDRHGEADWTLSCRVIAERADQAAMMSDRILGVLLDRDEQGRFLTEIPVTGQWVTNREPLDDGAQNAPSADGIVALVLRFLIRTQRA